MSSKASNEDDEYAKAITANELAEAWSFDAAVAATIKWKSSKSELPTYEGSDQKRNDDAFERAELKKPSWMINAKPGWQRTWRRERREDFYQDQEWNAKLAPMIPTKALVPAIVAVVLWGLGLSYFFNHHDWAKYVFIFVLATHTLESILCVYVIGGVLKWGWPATASWSLASFVYGWPVTSFVVGLYMKKSSKSA